MGPKQQIPAGRMPAALALSFAAAAAAAQPAVQSMGEVLVTATRTEQALADTLPSSTVITRRDIERSQSSGLVELLGRQAGVEFARAGGPGSQASVFMRATSSSQTLVLIDGVRLNTAIGGAAALGGVSLDAIERIEIVRGNLSSLYGSEAIGGVIQIFTRGAERSGVEAGGEAGSGRTWSGNVLLAQRFDAGSIALSAAARSSSPFSAIDTAQVIPGPFAPGANPDIDGNRNRNASLNAQGRVGALDLAASVWFNRNATDFDSTADGPAATHRETTDQRSMQASAALAPIDGLRVKLALGQFDDDSRNESSQPFSFNNSEFEADNRSAVLSAQWRIGPAIEATAAYEHLRQEGASTSYDADFGGRLTGFSRRVNSLRAGLAGDAGRHHVQANVRRDDYSDFGDATTGLAAYGFDLDPRWRLSAQWSSGFRAPSFNDLYFPFFGNPALAAEKSRSGELALRYGDERMSLRLAAYRTRVRDLIVYDPATQQAGNVASAEIDGAELIFAATIDGWRLQGDVGVAHPADRDTGERLLRRSPYRLHFAAARAFGPVEGLVEVTWNDRRCDSDINTFARTTLDAYTLARLALSWRLSDALRLTLRVENLFDGDYELVDGYNTAGRSAFAGVQLRI
jgi:vitamin B12 transporter